MKPKFTPRPWKIMNDKNGYPLIFNGVDGFNPICRLEHKAKFDRKIADANLIAAAPEMYEAAEQLIYRLEVCLDDLNQSGEAAFNADHEISILKTVLAKARGGQ